MVLQQPHPHHHRCLFVSGESIPPLFELVGEFDSIFYVRNIYLTAYFVKSIVNNPRSATLSEFNDHHVRLAAFEWLQHQVDVTGDDVLPWKLIAQGFEFNGRRVPLVSQQGIFKPAVCELPISIRTSLKGPYDDGEPPMLKHGLQGMHGMSIQVPRRVEDHPDPAALLRRYERFLLAT